jgi:hypothetical protein
MEGERGAEIDGQCDAYTVDGPSWISAPRLDLHTAERGLQNLYKYFVTWRR